MSEVYERVHPDASNNWSPTARDDREEGRGKPESGGDEPPGRPCENPPGGDSHGGGGGTKD